MCKCAKWLIRNIVSFCNSHTIIFSNSVLVSSRYLNPTVGSNTHCRIRIKHFAGLRMRLKGQSDNIFLFVNSTIMDERSWSKKSGGSLKLKCWHRRVSNFVIENLGEIEKEFENTKDFLLGNSIRIRIVKNIQLGNLVPHWKISLTYLVLKR